MATRKPLAVAASEPAKSRVAAKRSAVETSDAGAVREFRKTNEAIGLRIVEGRLTLLNRKLFNVMMFYAQQQKQPGQYCPIDTAAAKKYFWVPLADVATDANYDSKDTEFLKQQLDELQNVKLLMENDRQWTSERLVSSVTFANPNGLRKRGGQTWLGFAFPPEVHEQVMAPGRYTKFSIVYQGDLRSGASLALYEICRRYATNPTKVTMVESYEHWFAAITGNPVTDEPPPYKYFKRDVLKPAISEINAMTDIQIELIEHKMGRRVSALQFGVSFASQPQLEFPAPPLIDIDLITEVSNLGMAMKDAEDLYATFGPERVREALGFLRARLSQPNSAPID